MPGTKEKRIVLASVLKPADDTRMFGKLAGSLQTLSDSEIHVIGSSPSLPVHSEIIVHSIGHFLRISFARLAAPWKILMKIMSIRPQLLIVTTHELLLQALIAKVFTGCKVIYDVQENYFRNILYTDTFPRLLRRFIASYVRVKEFITSGFIDHFLLAESAYDQELTFPGRKKTVIRNKVRLHDVVPGQPRNDGAIRIIFTGTLAESTGVFSAINIASKLHELDNRIELLIAGFCSKEEVLKKLKPEIDRAPFIKLIGGDEYVPHQRIMQEISEADFGMISYEVNPSTAGSVPTKMYEYLGSKLPMICVNHQPWAELIQSFNAGIVLPGGQTDWSEIVRLMDNGHFYGKSPSDVYWESEELKLLEIVRKIMRLI